MLNAVASKVLPLFVQHDYNPSPLELFATYTLYREYGAVINKIRKFATSNYDSVKLDYSNIPPISQIPEILRLRREAVKSITRFNQITGKPRQVPLFKYMLIMMQYNYLTHPEACADNPIIIWTVVLANHLTNSKYVNYITDNESVRLSK